MPQCVDCGTETPREDLLGAPDELRCRKCVNKRYPIYDERPVRHREWPSFVTFGAVLAAVPCSLLYMTRSPLVLPLLVDPFAIWEGQYWRFLTAAFVHGDPIHLLFDVYWMWLLGRVVEQWMGPFLFAGFFVLVAVGSSAAQFLAGGSAIGLSGVVFGMAGLLYAVRLHKDFAAAIMTPRMVQFFVFAFVLCIILTYAKVMRIGNMAHAAGAVLGWLTGRAVLERQRVVFLAGICILVLVEIGITMYMPWDQRYARFQAQRALQQANEEQALFWLHKVERADPDDQRIRALVRELEGDKDPAKQQRAN
jgi:membrane associated rhomboid family serine protease